MSASEKAIIWFKKSFKGLFYLINEGKIVLIANPPVLKGLKWILSARFGRAYSKGYYEPALLKSLQSYLSADSTFLDVGGHAGYISLFASRLCKHVYCFEPEPNNFQFLKRIMTLNAIQNVTPLNLAVGKEEGAAKFKNGMTSSMGSISEDGDLEIKVVSLDGFCNANAIHKFDVIKIDVEGFGAEVIKGMRESIKKFKPVIFYELHNSAEMLELKNLATFGYTFLDINNQPVDLDHLPNQFAIAIPKT